MFKSDSRFLVVDDSQGARDLIRTALNQMNLKALDEAPNGKAGWDKVIKAVSDKRPYSLIFSDVNMPEMDGLKFLEMLRAEPKTQNIPVIMITTEGAKPTVIKAVMSGVSGYMVKPFGVEDVKKKMQEVFHRAQLDLTSIKN
jgi:two-component system, chemotaxis family, chemotaxis protein CheY